MDAGLYTVLEAAAYLSCGRSKLFELLRLGEIRVVKIGRATRVPRQELDRWIAEQMAPLAQSPSACEPGQRGCGASASSSSSPVQSQ